MSSFVFLFSLPFILLLEHLQSTLFYSLDGTASWTMTAYPFLDAERLRQAALDYVDRVEEEWSTGQRTVAQVRMLSFGDNGVLAPRSDLMDEDYHKGGVLGMRLFRSVYQISWETLDWMQVGSAMVGHLYNLMEDFEGQFVLDPNALLKNLKKLFPRWQRRRDVTAEQMRELIRGLGVVRLERGMWQYKLAVLGWRLNNRSDEAAVRRLKRTVEKRREKGYRDREIKLLQDGTRILLRH